MARGISLHIGLNSVDSNQYGGNALPLNACEFDAQDMESIAASQGFATRLLLTQNAHSDAVRNAIETAAGQLQPGDIFFLTYSGHGSNIDDSDFEEADGKDETWVLYDRNLIDDELYSLWSKFPKH